MDALGARPPPTLAGAFGVLQTGWGKREIASLASGALSGEGKTAEIADVEGLLPFDMRIDRVRLGDPQGHWLEIDGARFHLVPSALLRLKVEIATVGAERVALNRLPPSAPTREPPQPFTFPSLPELPKSLPVAVEVLRIFVESARAGAAGDRTDRRFQDRWPCTDQRGHVSGSPRGRSARRRSRRRSRAPS